MLSAVAEEPVADVSNDEGPSDSSGQDRACGPEGSELTNTIESIREAAKKKGLPTKLFDELAGKGKGESPSAIVITGGIAPSYGGIFSNKITLPESQYEKPAAERDKAQWSTFYNELFHAWWDNVFEESIYYNKEYDRLVTKGFYEEIYKPANDDWAKAMEEAYSETVGAMIMAKLGGRSTHYDLNYTVEAVGHSDRPGYNPEAEDIYPGKWEYRDLHIWVFGTKPPKPPKPADGP